MINRDLLILEIERAFKAAGADTRRLQSQWMPYSSVVAFIELGLRGERQVWVNVDDDGMCNVYLTAIYQVPEGKTSDDLDLGTIPLLFPPFPAQMQNLGETLVRRIREATVEDSEMIEAKPVPKIPPPVPISDLQTVADLINVYEKHFLNLDYDGALTTVLAKVGKVVHDGKVYGLFNGRVSYKESAAGSVPRRDSDGELTVHQNASYIKLAPFIAE